MKEDTEVFCKLRVTSANVSGNKPSATIVYNGIRATDWFSPFGISSKRSEKDRSDSGIVETLSKRPFTANSIVIIRPKFNPSSPKKMEAIGHGLRSMAEELSSNEDFRHSDINRRSGAPEPKTVDYIALRNKLNHVPVRPATSGCFSNSGVKKSYKRKNIMKTSGNYSAVSIKQTNDYSLDLTVQSVECSRKFTENDHRFSERAKTALVSSRSHLETFETDTIDGIKKSYMKRAQSAPAGAVRLLQLNGTSNGRKQSLYWRAKSAYHRKVIHNEEHSDTTQADTSGESRGSLLRPLMYTTEGDIKHGAGCPYKCKGCFKACLVSDDYFNKAELPDRTHSSWRLQHRIRRSPGFSVQLALAKSQPLYQMVHEKKTALHNGDDVKTMSTASTEKDGSISSAEDVITRTESLEISD